MTIDSRIDKIQNRNSIKAFATVIIDDCFEIKGVRLIEGNKGSFVSLPQRSFETKEGKTAYADIVTCTDAGAKEAIEKSVMAAYEIALLEGQDANGETLEEDALPFDQAMC